MAEQVKQTESRVVVPRDPAGSSEHLNPDGTKKRRKVDRIAQAIRYDNIQAENENKLPLTSDDPVLPVVVREIKEREKWWDR